MRRRASASPGRQAGFTLVEVLVAFTIIALTLTLAMRVLADGAGRARRGPMQADRIEEAASIVDQLIADPPSAARATDGRFSDGTRWAVRLTDVTARVVPGAPSRLFRIELFFDRPVGAPVFVTLAAASAR